MRVTIVQLTEGVKLDTDTAAYSAINREADDPNIDFYGEFYADYVDGVRDEASVRYEEAVKENGAWTPVSGSTFTPDRQYMVACFVQATNGASSDDIFANFGNGAMFFKITNNCVPGSAWLVPTKFVRPAGGVSGNIFERFIKAIQMLFEEIRAFFSMIFGR